MYGESGCRKGRTGSTKRVSNRKKRKKVKEQAVEYAELYARLSLETAKATDTVVKAFVFNNELPQLQAVEVEPQSP